jgi:hypothetical protein
MGRSMLTTDELCNIGQPCINLHNYYIQNYKSGQDILVSYKDHHFLVGDDIIIITFAYVENRPSTTVEDDLDAASASEASGVTEAEGNSGAIAQTTPDVLSPPPPSRGRVEVCRHVRESYQAQGPEYMLA